MAEIKKLRVEFNVLKEKQDNQVEFNQRLLDRFDLIDGRVKALEDEKVIFFHNLKITLF